MIFEESDDEIFKRIVSGIKIDTPEEVIDYSLMNEVELLTAFNEVKMRLYRLGEMVKAETEEGKDLHSRYYALLSVLKRRKLL